MIERYSQEHSRNGFAPVGSLSNTTKNGGKGSGNFGHEGREGKVGGSAPSKGGKASSSQKRAKKEETKSGQEFHSRYEGKDAPFDYDGDTFYPDKDGRGATTKDGKRTIMFPDEVLYARQQIVDNWKKEGLTEASYEHAKELYFATKRSSNITDQDPADKKKATKLADELGAVIRRYEEEHPEAYLG